MFDTLTSTDKICVKRNGAHHSMRYELRGKYVVMYCTHIHRIKIGVFSYCSKKHVNVPHRHANQTQRSKRSSVLLERLTQLTENNWKRVGNGNSDQVNTLPTAYQKKNLQWKHR